MHTTNYRDTFIEVADDCPIGVAEAPPKKGDTPTVAAMEYDMLANHPYRFTSDDVLFNVYAIKNSIASEQMVSERRKFFSKGQPCFRSSPLTKRYGWGVHSNAEGKIAIHPVESKRYRELASDTSLKQLKALRSRRA